MNGRLAQRGFTLIELLVTLAVIAIVISLGVPLYGQFTESSSLTSRSSELVASLNFARSEAVTRRTSVRLVMRGATWKDGWDIEDYTDPGAPVLIRTNDLTADPADVGMAEDGGQTELVFDQEGRVGAEATFYVCPAGDGGEGRQISISRFGRVQLTKVEC